VGKLKGSHSDVDKMFSYLKKYHGFLEEEIFVMKDLPERSSGDPRYPSRQNIVRVFS
jgi:hypothetical protein